MSDTSVATVKTLTEATLYIHLGYINSITTRSVALRWLVAHLAGHDPGRIAIIFKHKISHENINVLS